MALSEAQIKTAIAQLQSVRSRIGVGTTASQQEAIDSVLRLLGAGVKAAPAVTPTPVAWFLGVNLSSTEDGSVKTFSDAQLDTLAAAGITDVRIPTPYRYDAAVYQDLLTRLRKRSMRARLSAHTYGLNGDRIKDGHPFGRELSITESVDLALKQHQDFGSFDNWSLLGENEPVAHSDRTQRAISETIIKELRRAGYKGLIDVTTPANALASTPKEWAAVPLLDPLRLTGLASSDYADLLLGKHDARLTLAEADALANRNIGYGGGSGVDGHADEWVAQGLGDPAFKGTRFTASEIGARDIEHVRILRREMKRVNLSGFFWTASMGTNFLSGSYPFMLSEAKLKVIGGKAS